MSEMINNPLKMPLRMADSHKNEPRSIATTHKLIAMNPYLHAATAKNTRQAYQADILHYEQSGMPLPATTEDVVNYLQLFADKLNPRTLSRRLTALKHWYTYQGFDDPTSHPVIRKTLKGITNTYGKPKNKVPPLGPEQLSQMVAYLQQKDAMTSWRDNALLRLGYLGAFRRSELASIQYDHERHKG
jgi:site-specific recombinase XerD